MREMRRKDRMLPEDETLALLARAEYGVLATADGTGLPLATPLSYVLMDGAIYFHCAMTGHKLDNLAENPRVCFCAVDGVQAVYQGDFTTLYNSVLAHGAAAVVRDEAEKRRALLALCEKYLPGQMDKADASIDASLARTCVVRIDIAHLAGKAKRAQP